MIIIKKNIWLAFYLIVLTWIVFFASALYVTYQHTYDEFALEQKNVTVITANSLQSLLRQYEVVLDVLAADLIQNDSMPSFQDAKRVMEALVNVDKSMIAFGLFKPDGRVFAASALRPIPNDYNVLDQPQTRDSFLYTLESDRMVLGRSYYSELLESIVMPVRKAFRDRQGKVLFVLSSAIDIKKGFDFLISNEQENKLHDSYLYRERDRYFQIPPAAKIDDRQVYLFQIPESDVEDAVKQLENRVGLPYETIKRNNQVVINEQKHPNRQSLTASVYLEKYELWLTTEVKLDQVQHHFLEKALVLIAVFFVSLIIIFALFRSISANEKRKHRALQYLATHDYLTQLNNRYFLDRHMRSLHKGTQFALLFIDTDNFKTINDSYGHELGDVVLREIASRLKSLVKGKDLLIRYSGDEFVVVVYDKMPAQVEALCEQVLASLRQPYIAGEYRFVLTASIGVSNYPADGKNLDEIKRYADLAMYESKKTRNTATFFKDHLKEAYIFTAQVEHELKQALEHDELYLQYQPQVDQYGCIHGVEALIRWQNAKLGFVPPDKFIPVAEATGEMPAIGRFVIERSLSEMVQLRRETDVMFELSINVSVKQFQQPSFFHELMSLVQQHDFNHMQLVLEVTENVFIEDVLGIQSLMLKFKEQGIRISLDDFGTGYSSLSLLKRLPIDELKIDKSFVDDMLDDPNAFLMVEGIIAIAKKLKMSTVAEGIETPEQHQALAELGCDIFQGYYHAKPLRVEELKAFVFDVAAN